MEIYSLVNDIYNTVKNNKEWMSDEHSREFASDVSTRLQVHYSDTRMGPQKLRMSGLGPKCPRQLWYSIHHPELGEALPATALLKFSYGHILEAQTVMLAKASGHEVTGEQDVLELDGVIGHRDCVIDGCVVDVKSASSISFGKFQTVDYSLYDTFGYLDQLDAYVVASHADPLVRTKDRGYILAIDKQLGKIHLYEHQVRPVHIAERISAYRRIVDLGEPPRCECGTVSPGKSGNVELDVRASYSAYKHCCFPGLRTFLYAGGPKFLTTVVRRPQRSDGSYITEIDKHGKTVYH